MDFATVLKIIGWALVLIPLIAYQIACFFMMRGFAKDDEHIMALILLGFSLFAIGAVMLGFVYLTSLVG